MLWLKGLKIRPGNGAGVVVDGVTTIHGARESRAQGEGQQVFELSGEYEEHIVREPSILLTTLGKEPSENWRAGYAETCPSGSEGRPVKPGTAMC